VAYKPRKSNKLIVFEERQIESITATLTAFFSPALKNTAGGNVSSSFTTSDNTCSVTLNEPFLDGISWQTLLDVDRLSSPSNLAAIDEVLLPQCAEGEDPDVNKCARYSLLDNEQNKFDGRALLIITLWYTLEGINETNSIDLYYLVSGTSIKHGGDLNPQVTIKGRHAYDVILQENINPKFFEKDEKIVDELNKKALNSLGYEIEDICSTPADEKTMERTYRINGLTTKELVNKLAMSEEGGQVISLATKEFTNKVQICGKIDNSCYASRVFYLGKGLYEQYNIDSAYPTNDLEKNISPGSETPSIPGNLKNSNKIEYSISLLDPNTTSKKLEKVSADAFAPFLKQFENREDYQTGDVVNGWKVSAKDKNLTIEKIEKKALFGDAKSPITYLGGKVLKINVEEKSVDIETNFYIHVSNTSRKSFRMRVYEQYKNLSSILVKENAELSPNDPIGTINSDPQSRTIFRYYSKLDSGDIATIDPASIKLMLSSSKGLTQSEKQLQAPSNNSSDGVFVGKVGSTGVSSGSHVHIQESKSRTLSEAELFALAGKYVRVAGASLTSYTRGDGFGAGRDHKGIDFPIDAGKDITISGSIVASGAGVGGSNCGNGVAFKPPEGPELLICHLQDSSIPTDLSKNSVGTFSNSGKAETSGPGSSGIAKNGINLKTEFKGVPKALNIIPGRTVLSFISDYDNWVSNSKSSSIEPNIWIPEKYKNWQINQVTYEWENADLRVKIEGIRPWGASIGKYKIDEVPTFESYKQSRNYIDYYDYIRSSGDLCYDISEGKNSCAEYCKKPTLTSQASQPSDPSQINGVFGPGKYTYACSKYNQGESAGNIQGLLNTIDSLGIKNKNAVAGILGNSLQESSVNGIFLNPNALGAAGELGIFQWNGPRRVALEAYAKSIGQDPRNIQTQYGFFAKEMKEGYGSLIQSLNNAQSVEDAVREFEEKYERARTPAIDKRIDFANEVFSCLRP
jgi:hypothetical protein